MVKRVLLYVLVLGCNGALVESPPAQQQVVSSPPVVAAPPSATTQTAPPAPSNCMSPLDGAMDPKYGPKPVDQRKLAEIDASPADPTEKAYGRARTFFETQHWVEAAIGFREIAMDHPELDVGVYASQLYLESLNVIGAQAHRTACYVDMAQDVPKFRELYCTTRRKANAEQCTILDHIEFDIRRMQADQAMQRH